MEKLTLKTNDLIAENIAKLSSLFPEILTEVETDGKIIRTVNADKLKELIGDYADNSDEFYELNWVGKQRSRQKIVMPINKTLRPVVEDSVDFENTENLYIEGDNFEVLKLLQESYLNKIKMIYIDPPYNTGNDFVYKDNFAMSREEYDDETGAIDEEGNKLFRNTTTNGRFHSDWLSMMFERLVIARDLLRDDGVIFISIDDNEVANLRKICDEVFGEDNFLVNMTIKVRYEGKTLVEDMDFQKLVENVFVYAKLKHNVKLLKIEKDYEIDKFEWYVKEISKPEIIELGGKIVEKFNFGDYEIQKGKPSKIGLKEIWASGSILEGNSSGRFFRDYLAGRKDIDGLGILYKVHGIGDDELPHRYFTGAKKASATKGKYYQGIPINILENFSNAKKTQPIVTFYDLAASFGNCRHEGSVDFRNGKKPLELLKKLFSIIKSDNLNDIILDFFSGSATTAHAVMQLNAEDGGNRKFIMVQLPEPTAEDSEAFKAGYKNICEIGKERIRRAAKKIKEDNTDKDLSNIDFGFRVFRTDSSNMKDVYYNPKDIAQMTLTNFRDNIKEDRTDKDLLYQVLLELTIPISAKIREEKANNKTIYRVNDNFLIT